MMAKGKLIAATAGLAALLGLVWAFTPRPFPVEAVEVKLGRFEQAIEDDGKTRVRERYVISAPIAGRMERVELDPGDLVKRGQVLAVLHPMVPPLIDARAEGELRERVGAAEAAVARSVTAVERGRASLAKATADLERTQALAARSFVSRAQVERDELTVTINARELDALRFEQHAAQHQLELARAALARSRAGWHSGRGEKLEIRSPVDGAVFRVPQENEAAIATGSALIELADPQALEVVVDVLSSDAVQIQAGARARLHHFGGGRELEGRVRRVEPSAFTKVSALGVEEQRVNVIIDFVSPPAEWRSLGDGYRVDARIVIFAADNALTVPVGSIFRDGAGWAAFVIRDGVARKQPIELTRRSSTEALLTKGLAPGERVILYPAERVQDGTKVRLITLR
jgi:HlyD family secretion protein